MKKYRVRFSGWVWAVTLAVFAVGLLVVLFLLSGVFRWWYAILLLLLLDALFIPVLYTPRHITFDGENLRLKRLLGSIVIPRSQIRAVECCHTMAHSVCLFGTPGYMGYMGYFRGEGKGFYVAYVGDDREMFWVVTPERCYLFSCRDRDGLLAEITASLESAAPS